MHMICMLYSVYVPNSEEKEKLFWWREWAGSCCFHFSRSLALEADAFGVKEPVAGQLKAENKHFSVFGCLFLGFFSQKSGPERSSSVLGDIFYKWFSFLCFRSCHGLFPHKTVPLKLLLLLFSRSSVRQFSITCATKLNDSILNPGRPLTISWRSSRTDGRGKLIKGDKMQET